jgi:hypothetical protein
MLRRLHGGRVDVDQDAQFREKACFAEFQQLRASAHARKRTRALGPGHAPEPPGELLEARRDGALAGHGVLSDPAGTFELRYKELDIEANLCSNN